MNESIRENVVQPRLPDCCNLGIWLRVLLASNAGGLLVAFACGGGRGLLAEFLDLAPLLESIVMAALLSLCVLRRPLARMHPRQAQVLIVGLVLLITTLLFLWFAPLLGGSLRHALIWAALAAAGLLAYFELRARAQAPALAEARLMALNARIRPHFLFNSINAVLGVMRSDPRRAERALEEMSDLFRALMRDNRDLVPLSDEMALARQYLELEKLRLGDRLQVRWDIDSCPVDTLVPPLMLQPLLENAVYHGIEAMAESGELRVRMTGDPGTSGHLIIEISNPVVSGGEHTGGNRMALDNIRERLMLFYDLEARLEISEKAGYYSVLIILPKRPRS